MKVAKDVTSFFFFFDFFVSCRWSLSPTEVGSFLLQATNVFSNPEKIRSGNLGTSETGFTLSRR